MNALTRAVFGVLAWLEKHNRRKFYKISLLLSFRE